MSFEDTSVLILAGGQGTRLRSKVSTVPKPLAPINGRPFVSYLLENIIVHRPRKIVLCTGYMAGKFNEYIGDSYQGFAIDYSVEVEALGTGGALRQALAHVNTDTVMVCNGDSYCDADLMDFERWHSQKSSTLSMMLTHVPDTSRYGRVEVDEQDRIRHFHEKQPQQGAGWINAGMYLAERDLLAEIPEATQVSIERDFFQQYLNSGRVMYGYPCWGNFIDIGTPESYDYAQEFFEA